MKKSRLLKVGSLLFLGFLMFGAGCKDDEQLSIIREQQKQIDSLHKKIEEIDKVSAPTTTVTPSAAKKQIKKEQRKPTVEIKTDPVISPPTPVVTQNQLPNTEVQKDDPLLSIEKCRLRAKELQDYEIKQFGNNLIAGANPIISDLNNKITLKNAERNECITLGNKIGFSNLTNNCLNVTSQLNSLENKKSDVLKILSDSLNKLPEITKTSYDQEYSKCINSL